MYEKEYKELVWADYETKKAAGLLLSELLVHTPGSLKAACLKVCERRFNDKDEIILESFFNKKENAAAYQRAIELAKADLFRSLNTYLGDPLVNTTMRNINLLAWLIDFKPRPFHPDLIIPSKPGPGKPLRQLVLPTGPKGITKKNVLFSVLLLLIISSAGYYIFHKKGPLITGKEGCMIWEDDHYQPIDCKDVDANIPCYPIDHKLVANFKRITEPDTLTPRSIKKVWYAKFNGQVEFFTADGPFPLDTTRRLLPMTGHILNTYVYHIKD